MALNANETHHVKLREPNASSVAAEATPITLEPLQISGVVVNKRELIDKLRIYVPQLEVLAVFEDGEQFLLKVRRADPTD